MNKFQMYIMRILFLKNPKRIIIIQFDTNISYYFYSVFISGSSKTGEIVGAVFGVLIFLSFVAAITCCCIKCAKCCRPNRVQQTQVFYVRDF